MKNDNVSRCEECGALAEVLDAESGELRCEACEEIDDNDWIMIGGES
jgi:transcription initiation factor TFIIIB Brf1 subunit/transcription initiation factor TFIIB